MLRITQENSLPNHDDDDDDDDDNDELGFIFWTTLYTPHARTNVLFSVNLHQIHVLN